jgi:hypothetical protein
MNKAIQNFINRWGSKRLANTESISQVAHVVTLRKTNTKVGCADCYFMGNRDMAHDLNVCATCTMTTGIYEEVK